MSREALTPPDVRGAIAERFANATRQNLAADTSPASTDGIRMAPARGRLASHGFARVSGRLPDPSFPDDGSRFRSAGARCRKTARSLPGPPVAGDTPPEAARAV